MLCKSTKIFVFLKKRASKKLFQEYINKIMLSLFVQGTGSKGNIICDNLFHETDTYEEKYIIKGVHFALFNNFVKELEIEIFLIFNCNHENTQKSCSWYYENNGSKTIKN